MMSQELMQLLDKNGFCLYPQSLRSLQGGGKVFVAKRGVEKFVGVSGGIALDGPIFSEAGVSLHNLTWENYEKLKEVLPISPSPCDRDASFGTGDRLGLVTAAHLDVDSRYPVFPVVSQQSPRELTRTNRTFKSVLLDAVTGLLESGYTGRYGADADHIKDENYLREGVAAGYSMYTLDVSEWLQDLPEEASGVLDKLSPLSTEIVKDLGGTKVPGTECTLLETELINSAFIYEKSMEQVKRFNGIIGAKLSAYDLEVSIDEGSRDTTPEDHAFVAEYLHRSGVDFKSLAPKFPGEFQKAVDYMGDKELLADSFRVHASLARMFGGYRLSLHSGSDKFSVYPLFSEATGGNFHIKTSGTSWLMAVKLVASENPDLFREMYDLCLTNLDESKKAYHVYITKEHFRAELPDDLIAFYEAPDVRQLFHISYGVLLDARRAEIYDTLNRYETKHYQFVQEHIERHLKLLF